MPLDFPAQHADVAGVGMTVVVARLFAQIVPYFGDDIFAEVIGEEPVVE
jgi:hypothetical protein